MVRISHSLGDKKDVDQDSQPSSTFPQREFNLLIVPHGDSDSQFAASSLHRCSYRKVNDLLRLWYPLGVVERYLIAGLSINSVYISFSPECVIILFSVSVFHLFFVLFFGFFFFFFFFFVLALSVLFLCCRFIDCVRVRRVSALGE